MGFENSNLYSRVKDVMVFLGDNSLRGDKRFKGVLILSDDLLLDGSQIFWYDLAFSRGVVFYYHNDHLGTPQVMTDITGNVVWKADYEPFGKVNIVVEEIENNFRFPGQYYISETGLYYNWWRWYKSETGRYMEPDFEIYRINNINIPQQNTINHISLFLYNSQMIEYSFDLYMNFSWNNYIYSSDNPINMFDIDGEKTEKPKPPDFPPKEPKKPSCYEYKEGCFCLSKFLRCCPIVCDTAGGPGKGGTAGLKCYFVRCCK